MLHTEWMIQDAARRCRHQRAEVGLPQRLPHRNLRHRLALGLRSLAARLERMGEHPAPGHYLPL